MQPASTILIVDDELIGRRLLQGMLEDRGYRLITACNGADALAKAAEVTPDLVLLDVMMPGIDGFEVCRRLRRDERLREVPIIFLTALSDQPSRLQGIEVGADDFLTKPYDMAELRLRVRTITQLNRYRLLLAERANFQRVVESAPDGLLILDRQGAIHLANTAMRRMWAAETAEGNAGPNIAGHILPEHRARLLGWLEVFPLDEQPVLLCEIDMVRSDGNAFPVEVTGRAFSWNNQPAVQVQVRDLTEKKKLEKQFLHTQRLQCLGTIASGVAHDLNNVLAPILASVDFFRAELHQEANLQLLDIVQASARRGADMVRQVLAFARSAECKPAPLLLKHPIRELDQMLRRTLPPSFQVSTTLGANLVCILGDATQCYQAIMNLCVNARDAMRNGGRLAIVAENIEVDGSIASRQPGLGEGRYVRVTVADTGPGIAPEVRAHLFEPFFTTKEKGKGTGLGLATVMNIVKQHGGLVTVESEMGRGNQFHLYFPALDSTGAPEPDSTPTPIPPGHGELVLIVDDDQAMRLTLAAVIRRHGYRTETAADGAEAIATFARQPDDIRLLVADMHLPCLDGGGVARVIRRIQPRVGIILITAQLDRSLWPDLTDLRDIPQLTKPFSMDTMFHTMRETLLLKPA